MLDIVVVTKYIHVVCVDKGSAKSFFITFVYASINASRHKGVWDHLRALEPITSYPWILGGDFNAICSLHCMRGRVGLRIALVCVLVSVISYFRLDCLIWVILVLNSLGVEELYPKGWIASLVIENGDFIPEKLELNPSGSYALPSSQHQTASLISSTVKGASNLPAS
ncbi:hypothetical protein V6N13_080720 [Hibiscus sabdariffa]